MAEYKCIMCGEIADSKEIRCCPVCGYRMFPTPYEKMQILREDISNFLLEFCKMPVDCRHFGFTRQKSENTKKKGKINLESDQQRFPSFEKIFGYVVSSKKTEEFLDRLQSSIENIQKHISQTFSMTYTVEAGRVLESLKYHNDELAEILELAGMKQKPDQIQFPEITLEYAETPDEILQPYVQEMLELLDALMDKIRKFIKRNHLFGAFYKNADGKRFKVKSQNFQVQFEKQNRTLQKILNKKYVVDLLSDGSDEVCEMIDTVWKSIALLTKLHVLKSTYHFQSDTFECEGIKELQDHLVKIAAESVFAVSEEIKSGDFMSGLDEKELFKLYNSMIGCDSIGYFRMDKSRLLNVGEYEVILSIILDTIISNNIYAASLMHS